LKVFEEEVVAMVGELLQRHPTADGIVLVGGCALNVGANSAVAAAFGLPVHVPAAPSDCGLAVGSAWLVAPPPRTGHPSRGLRLHLLGPRLFDLEYEASGSQGEIAVGEPVLFSGNSHSEDHRQLTVGAAANLTAMGGVHFQGPALIETLAALLCDDQVLKIRF
jgi:hypothetical protein